MSTKLTFSTLLWCALYLESFTQACDSAYFSYAQASYCLSGGSIGPDSVFPLGGFFESLNQGIIMDSLGNIDLGASQSGTYVLQYQSPDTCADRFHGAITLLPKSNPAFYYPQFSYCQNQGFAAPVIQGLGGGYFWTLANLPDLDSITGFLDLTNAPIGTHIINYTSPTPCPDTASFSLNIISNGNAAFALSYPQYEYCQSDSFATPNTLSDSLGTFTESTGGLVFTNPNLGQIDLGRSSPGAYFINYTSSGLCPIDTVLLFTLNQSPDALLISTAEDNSILCVGDSVEFLAFGGDSYAFWLNDTLIQAYSFTNRIKAPRLIQDQDKIRMETRFEARGTCSSTDSLIMQVKPSPRVIHTEYSEKVIGGEDIEIQLEMDLDSSLVHWWFELQDGILAQKQSGTSAYIHAGTIWRLQESFSLESELSPGQLSFIYYPQAQGCSGDLDTLNLQILPDNEEIFIPGLISPNGDGKNDAWEIRYTDQVYPDKYVLTVFNRSGGTVHRQKGLDSGWNPTGIPDGVYWYALEKDGILIKRNGLKISRK